MGTLATLTIDLVGQSAKLRADLNKASKDTKSWSEKTRQLVNASSKAFTAMGVAGAAAWVAIYRETAKTADQLAKTSDKLGILPEKLQAIQHAGELTGVGVETTNMALQRMVRRVAEAAQGTGEAVGALNELNLSADDLAKMSPDEQFKAIADAMGNVSNQGDKVRLAMKLFDSEGVSLVNTLDLGRQGLNAMEQEVNNLGMAMDRVSLAKIEAANDSFDRATKATSSFGNALTTQTAPIVGALSDMFTQAAMDAGGFGNMATQVMQTTATGIGFVADMGRGLHAVFLGLRQIVAETTNYEIQAFRKVAEFAAKIDDFFGLDTSYMKGINEFADSYAGTTERLNNEFQSLLMDPMPSEKIDNWIKDTQKKFEYSAQKLAADKKTKINFPVGIGDSSDEADGNSSDNKAAKREAEKNARLVESARNRYRTIYDEQLKQDGREVELENRRYQRLQDEMQREIELLREKGIATQAVEDEFKQAEIDAKAQHSAKLVAIEDEKNAKIREGYSALLGVVGSYYDGMEGKKAAYARAAINLGQLLLDKEKQQALQSIVQTTYETAMDAYGAMAKIPIVGPALGATAAGVVIAAGTGYAAQVSGLASFDGGGYTWDGPRTGGLDGKGGQLAMLHPQETVVDHTKGQGMATIQSGDSVTIDNINVTVISRRRGDIMAEVSAVLPDLTNQIKYHLSRPA